MPYNLAKPYEMYLHQFSALKTVFLIGDLAEIVNLQVCDFGLLPGLRIRVVLVDVLNVYIVVLLWF